MNESPKPPWTVWLACAASLAVCIWDIAWLVSDEEAVESMSFLAVLLVLNAIPVVFTFAAFLKRNWGRLSLAVITVLGASTLPFVMFSEGGEPIDTETVVYSLTEVAIVVLLFVPVSNKWYRKPRCWSPPVQERQ